MIKNKNETNRNLEKALQALEQAKQIVANEKKKQNVKKRKAEKPLPHNPLSPMPKMKVRAVRLPLVNFAFRQKPKCGFYLPTKSIHAPHYPIGRM